MTFDEVQGRLDVLRSNLESLDRIPQTTYEEFVSDFRNVPAAIYLVQTSVQALIDLGSWLVARLGLETPRRSQEVFERLEAAGELPAGTAERCIAIVGFRNRVVHLYDRVDSRIVYEIVTEHRRDLAEILLLLLSIRQPDRG